MNIPRFSSLNGSRYGIPYTPGLPKATFREFKDTLETTVGTLAGKNDLKALITYGEPTQGWTIFARDGSIIPDMVEPVTVRDSAIDFAMVQFLDPERLNEDPAHNAAMVPKLLQAQTDFQAEMFKAGIFNNNGPIGYFAARIHMQLLEKLQRLNVDAYRMVDVMHRAFYLNSQQPKP